MGSGKGIQISAETGPLIGMCFEAVEVYIMNFKTLFRLDLAILQPIGPGHTAASSRGYFPCPGKKSAGLQNEIALKIVLENLALASYKPSLSW